MIEFLFIIIIIIIITKVSETKKTATIIMHSNLIYGKNFRIFFNYNLTMAVVMMVVSKSIIDFLLGLGVDVCATLGLQNILGKEHGI